MPLAPPATDGGVLIGFKTPFRVTRRVQASSHESTLRTDTGLHVPIQDCGAVRGEWRQNDHTKRVSLYLPRPTAGLRHVCMCIQRARAPTGGGKHTSKAASCSAHSPGRRGPAFRMPVAQMQAAPRSIAKKLATEIAGAKALERARRGGCCRKERKAACRRHGEPAQARPRPHRLEGGAARRAREERGVALNIAVWPRIDRMALFYDRHRRGCAVMKRLLLGKARHI